MYPLMFPIYVAEFEHTSGDDIRRFNVVMDAHDEDVSREIHDRGWSRHKLMPQTRECRVSWPPPPKIVQA